MTSRRLLDPVSKALLDAADYMERYGHCKHQAEDRTGRVCLMGAIGCVTFGRVEGGLAADRLALFLSTLPASWNDVPERTADEAIAALRGAAIMEVEPAVAEG